MKVIVTKEPLCSLVYFLFCIYIAFVEAPFAWIQAIDFFSADLTEFAKTAQ